MRNCLYSVALALLCGTAQAATVMKTAVRDLASNKESVATVYAQDGKMRVESGGPQENFAIFTGDAVNAVNPKERNYVSIDRASIKQMAATANPALKQLEARMAGMSPEQRAQMEKMLGAHMPSSGSKPVVEETRKTGKSGKMAGYSCSYTEVLRDGVVVSEICVTPVGALKGGNELYDASAKLGALMEDMLKEIDAPWLREMANRQIENYGKLGGIPVFTRIFRDGKPVRESTLQSIATQAAPAGAFEIPAGFTRKEMMRRQAQ
jgi:hypothetical protein